MKPCPGLIPHEHTGSNSLKSIALNRVFKNPSVNSLQCLMKLVTRNSPKKLPEEETMVKHHLCTFLSHE